MPTDKMWIIMEKNQKHPSSIINIVYSMYHETNKSERNN